MKADIISDIHLTCHRDHGSEWVGGWVPEGEILILAGDVGEFHWWQTSAHHLEALCEKYQHVLYIAGNHDYYGTTLEEGDARFRRFEALVDNFHFLERNVLEIGGTKFAGCTLWFKKDPTGDLYEKWMRDFELIQEFKPTVYDRNLESQAFLQQIPYETDVVITHHMPTHFSVHEKYNKDPCNRFFLCEMDQVILDLQPKLWVHGHTHVPFDYKLGETRIICNPEGYPRENPGPYKPVTVEL